MQVYVHADPKCREKVIETYTFNIKYLSQAEDGSRVLAGLEMDSPGNSLVSVGATNAALQFLFRQLISVCETLPDLPGTLDRLSRCFAARSGLTELIFVRRKTLRFDGAVLRTRN